MEERYEVFSITAEDGGEMQVAVVDSLEENGKEYYAVIPLDDKGEMIEDTELIVGVLETDENGDQYFTEIEDDDEFDHVSQTFIDRLEAELDEE